MNPEEIQHSAEIDLGRQEDREEQLRVTHPDPDRYSLCDKLSGEHTSQEMDAEIGRGGIGRVLIAFDKHLGRRVAIKELLPAKVGQSLEDVFLSPAPADTSEIDPEQIRKSKEKAKNTVARFLREARVTGQLGHPSIVPVYELGQKPDGTLYYTMKVVRGRTLGQALDKCKNLKERMGLLTHFIDLCHAIAYAHSRGVVHRDIKPDNVMVGEFGETVVLDWGLSKVKGVADTRGRQLQQDIELLKGLSTSHTVDGTAIGTPAYMSPEQALGEIRSIDERSDIWSLGAVLYRILTGRSPFSGDTAFEVIAKVQRGEFRAPQMVSGDIPPELASICTKAMERERDRRYQDARKLADDVSSFLTGGRVRAYEYNMGDLLRKWISRHRVPVTTVAVSLLILVALGITSYVNVVRERDIAQRLKKEADSARQQAKVRMAEALWEGARSDLLNGDMLEARAKLRSSIEVTDSVSGRMLWSKALRTPLVWKKRFSSPLHSMALSPSGNEIAVGGLDGSIYRIDEETSGVKVLRGHKSWVASLCYSHDGKRMFSAGADKIIRIWDLDSGKLEHSMIGHLATIHDITLRKGGDVLASCSQDKTIRLWDTGTGKQIQKLESFGTIAWSMVFSPDGKRLFAGCRDGSIHVLGFDGGKLRPLGKMKQATGGVSALAISTKGDVLASGSNDGKIYTWDLVSGDPASGNMEASDLERKTAAKVLTGHTDGIAELAFAPDCMHLASGSYDSTIRIWSIHESTEKVPVIREHKDWIAGVEFSPDGKYLVSASEDNTVALWKLPIATQKDELQAKAHDGALTTVAMDPSGSIIATGGEDRAIILRNAKTGAFMQVLRGHTEPIYGLKFRSPRMLLSADWSKKVITWVRGKNGFEKKSTIQLGGDGDLNTNVAIDASGRYIAAADYDRTIRLWDLATGKERIIKGHSDLVRAVSFSHDSKYLASASWDRTVRVWDTKTGRCTHVLRGHISEVNDVIFGPGDKSIYSIAWDLSIRKWVLATGQKSTIGMTKERYDTIAICPNGTMLAGAMSDGRIELWDLATGRESRFKAHDGAIYDLTFSPDSAKIVSVSEDGTVRSFDTRTMSPAWKGPVMLTRKGAPPLVYTHEGWIEPGRGKVEPNLQPRKWISAAQKSRYTTQHANTVCMQTNEGLSIWNSKDDVHVLDAYLGQVDDLIAFDGGCAVVSDGDTSFYYADREASLVLPHTGAMALDGDKLLIAYDGHLHILEDSGLQRGIIPISPGPSAVASLMHQDEQWLLAGYGDGTIEIHTLDGRPISLSLQQSPSSPVRIIVPGPMSTAIVGFSNGLLGLWDLDSGIRLDAARLHGRPLHLKLFGGYLYAASDLGNHLKWDLSVFENSYCDLLRSIWKQVPVVWEESRAVKKRPQADHACLTP